MKISLRAILRDVLLKVVPLLLFTALGAYLLYEVGFKHGSRDVYERFQMKECWLHHYTTDVVCIEYID